MIIVKLVGGQGNQMFQYAVGRRLSINNRVVLKLDLSWYRQHNESTTKRSYMLGVYKIKESFASSSECLGVKWWRGSYIERVLANRLPGVYERLSKIHNGYYLENATKSFMPEILNIKGNAYLDGDWQSEKYFVDIRNILLKDFIYRDKLDSKNSKLISKIKRVSSVSLHVRRGDYVTNKIHSKFYSHCSYEYYRKAIEIISQKSKNLQLFIFSDDPQWVRRNMKFPLPTYYVTENSTEEGYKDMVLMSSCKHNIIANSSFSWWGAWLNQNRNKIVVAPKKWFAKNNISSSNIVCDSWIKI